jgi:hypothetical protein
MAQDLEPICNISRDAGARHRQRRLRPLIRSSCFLHLRHGGKLDITATPCETCHHLDVDRIASERITVSTRLLRNSADQRNQNCGHCQLLLTIVDHFDVRDDELSISFHTGHKHRPLLIWLGGSRQVQVFCSPACEGTQHAALRPGNLPTAHSSSDESFNRLRGWIRDCDQEHECMRGAGITPLPTRVIDVGLGNQNRPFLVETNNHTGIYAALSYCWGSSHQVKLTRATLPDFNRSLPLEQISKTANRAIRICQRLSIPCLWIDALCIIQDDRSDWLSESSKMCEVYSDSFPTLAAGAHANCTDGIFSARSRGPEGMLKITYRNHVVYAQLSWLDGHLARPLAPGLMPNFKLTTEQPPQPELLPLSQRSWTLQERIMPRRTVYYIQEMWWKCNECIYCECGWTDADIGEQTRIEYSFYGWLRAPTTMDLTLKEAYEKWRDIVILFSTGSVTRAEDKLPTFSGLARKFDRMLSLRFGKGDTYLCGLWRADLPRGLL